MWEHDGKEYRCLQEQVEKNKSDIEFLKNEEGTLNAFGVKIVGTITAPSLLPNAAEYLAGGGEYGDTYAVGTEPPYTLYVLTRANTTIDHVHWFNIGNFPVPGPQGDRGPQGHPGEPGPSTKWTSRAAEPSNPGQYKLNDQWLNTKNGDVYEMNPDGSGLGQGWYKTGNIRGPQGIPGQKGADGAKGDTGSQGEPGPKGEPGQVVKLVGILSSASKLPTPTEAIRADAYVVGSPADYDIYVIVGAVGSQLKWVNIGKFESIAGPQGARGPEGPQGKPGPQGQPGAKGEPGDPRDAADLATMINGSSDIVVDLDAEATHVEIHLDSTFRNSLLYKATEQSIAYTTDSLGTQTTTHVDTTPNPNSLVKRTASGQVKTVDPVEDNDAVSLSYFNANKGGGGGGSKLYWHMLYGQYKLAINSTNQLNDNFYIKFLSFKAEPINKTQKLLDFLTQTQDKLFVGEIYPQANSHPDYSINVEFLWVSWGEVTAYIHGEFGTQSLGKIFVYSDDVQEVK